MSDQPMHLKALDGRGISTQQLHGMVERYYQLKAVAAERVCGACIKGDHYLCSGGMVRVPGSNNRHDLIPCPCSHSSHQA